jgi:hypothetical protein
MLILLLLIELFLACGVASANAAQLTTPSVHGEVAVQSWNELGYSASYAQENDRSVFFMGEVGASTGLVNCFGTCSADPSKTIGIGYSFDFVPFPGSEPNQGTISLEYARYQFNINGNAINAVRKEVVITDDAAFDKQRRFILSWGVALGSMTVSGPNTPSSTYFDPALVARLLYQVNPALYLSFGYTHEFIVTPNQPDFIANSADAGLRWYFF